MTINFLKAADFLQGELQEFYRVLRRGNDNQAIRTAAERLRAAMNEIEPIAQDPGDAWKDLPSDQRWGYLRVLSHLGTADHPVERDALPQRLSVFFDQRPFCFQPELRRGCGTQAHSSGRADHRRRARCG